MGYNNRNRGYDNYDRRGYDPRPQYYGGDRFDRFNSPNFSFKIGEDVIHRATGMNLSVIRYGREQVECRKPDLGTVWCYEHELEHKEREEE